MIWHKHGMNYLLRYIYSDMPLRIANFDVAKSADIV